ncbi:MAG: hypothetical protein FWG25_07800 [Promicromonosporaceae bacterium]|nr:hypothetical protein [Promicromonosporaceae bacterium]
MSVLGSRPNPELFRGISFGKRPRARSAERIDGAVAMVMGLARATLRAGAETQSPYEDRGLLFI